MEASQRLHLTELAHDLTQRFRDLGDEALQDTIEFSPIVVPIAYLQQLGHVTGNKWNTPDAAA